MSAERVERRLAAILAADVAGYSQLMGQDEAGTLARLKALLRELIDPAVAEHKGRNVTRTRPRGLAAVLAASNEHQRFVVPAKAGTHSCHGSAAERWVPAFAGTTNKKSGMSAAFPR